MVSEQIKNRPRQEGVWLKTVDESMLACCGGGEATGKAAGQKEKEEESPVPRHITSGSLNGS